MSENDNIIKSSPEKASLINSAIPILFLLGIILYGLVLRPYFFQQSIIPLEVIFLSAAFFASSHLLYLGVHLEYNFIQCS